MKYLFMLFVLFPIVGLSQDNQVANLKKEIAQLRQSVALKSLEAREWELKFQRLKANVLQKDNKDIVDRYLKRDNKILEDLKTVVSDSVLVEYLAKLPENHILTQISKSNDKNSK